MSFITLRVVCDCTISPSIAVAFGEGWLRVTLVSRPIIDWHTYFNDVLPRVRAILSAIIPLPIEFPPRIIVEGPEIQLMSTHVVASALGIWMKLMGTQIASDIAAVIGSHMAAAGNVSADFALPKYTAAGNVSAIHAVSAAGNVSADFALPKYTAAGNVSAIHAVSAARADFGLPMNSKIEIDASGSSTFRVPAEPTPPRPTLLLKPQPTSRSTASVFEDGDIFEDEVSHLKQLPRVKELAQKVQQHIQEYGAAPDFSSEQALARGKAYNHIRSVLGQPNLDDKTADAVRRIISAKPR